MERIITEAELKDIKKNHQSLVLENCQRKNKEIKSKVTRFEEVANFNQNTVSRCRTLHRLIASDGKLGAYSSGLHKKCAY